MKAGGALAAWTPAPSAPVAVALPALLPSRQALLHALGWQAAGLLGFALHVLLVREGGVALAAPGLAALTLLYARLPLAGLGVYWQVSLYQNAVLALFAGGMSPDAFQVLIGSGFMATGLLGAVAATRLLLGADPRDRRARALGWLAAAAIALAVLYAAYGAVVSTPVSAAIYFRATTGMLLMLLIGLDAGRWWDYRAVAFAFVAAVIPGLLYTAVEIADPEWLYGVAGSVDFMNLKYGPAQYDWPFHSPADLVATRTAVFFNVTGSEASLLSFRFGGANIHPISHAYVLAIAGLVALTLRQGWVALLTGVLLVLAGVKGALVVFATSLGFHAAWRLLRSPRLLLAGMALFVPTYATAVILFGLETGDFHVIGLIGGVQGLLRNPLGHGIGAGGNLSADIGAGLDLVELQRHGADFALESAVGVLLYQLGIATLAIGLVFARTLRAALPAVPLRRLRPARTDILLIGLAMTVVNGLFQEEAYTPYALGTLMLLAGVLAANLGRGAGRR